MSPRSTTATMGGEFPFGVRKRESGSSSTGGSGSGVDSVKVSKDSHRIRKPPLPLPQVQYRPPIIIHTYSPKVIHTEPDDFMTLVQKLTGSTDTRLRLKKDSPSKSTKKKKTEKSAAEGSDNSQTRLERQGSGSSAGTTTSTCGSPSTSEDSSFLVSDHNETVAMKQSNSPRSPLDSQFEFDNVSTESMFSQFDATSTGSPFSISQQVKSEPMFSFGDVSNNSFSFFADFMQPMSSSRPVPVTPPMSTRSHHQIGLPDMDRAVMDHQLVQQAQQQQSSTFVSANLMNHHLPDLSSGSAWSQSFLDCLTPASNTVYQAPFPRQRFAGPGYAPIPESSTMVALENIHAFMMT